MWIPPFEYASALSARKFPSSRVYRGPIPRNPLIASGFKENPAGRRTPVHPDEIPFHKEITHLIRAVDVLGEHVVNSAACEKIIDWCAIEAAGSQGVGKGQA